MLLNPIPAGAYDSKADAKVRAAGHIPIVCPSRGSALRPNADGSYRSLVAIGGPAQTTVGIGASATLDWTVKEAGWTDRLVIMLDGESTEVEVTAISHNNDPLITGSVPASLFAHDSVFNPPFGHWFAVSDSASVTMLNNDAAAVKAIAAFTCR